MSPRIVSLSGVLTKSAVILLLCIGSTLPLTEEREALLVQTAQGPVRGYKDPAEGIFVFYGIPYATAPTGHDRYKAPRAAPAWLTPFEAVDDSIICPQALLPQLQPLFARLQMRENCLVANIYVPNTKEKNIPVVVYVHGGAFQLGYGNFIPPNKLVKAKNVIVVTFNYRLGIHGFLCLGTEDIPGNAGMKDQVALLRWVKNNIANFGGKPDDVTIAGFSAGSASVDLLMISPATKGLFTKVIPESGGSLAAFSVQIDPIQNARDFANRFKISNLDDVYALEEFYKTATYDTITSDLFWDRKDSTFLFSPCVERSTAEEIFLGDSPHNILKSGTYEKVPLLYGFANMEGLLRVEFFDSWKEDMNDKFSDFLPADLLFENKEEKEKISKEIKEFYFDDNKVSESNILAYVDYFSDVIFTYPMLRAVQLHGKAGHNKVYLYEYSFVDDNTPVVPYTNVRGANHCAQTEAVLDLFLQNVTVDSITSEFMAIRDNMRDLWTNFIKTGSPVPKGSLLPAWTPAGPNGSPYMSLGRTIELHSKPLLEKRMRMWDRVYEKYYRVPLPPPAPPARPNIKRTEF